MYGTLFENNWNDKGNPKATCKEYKTDYYFQQKIISVNNTIILRKRCA